MSVVSFYSVSASLTRMITCAQTVALRHAGKSQDNAGGTGRFFPGQGLIVGRGMPDFFGNQKGVADFGT